jgi:hypothetical protein
MSSLRDSSLISYIPSTYVLGSIIPPLRGLAFIILWTSSNSLSEPYWGYPSESAARRLQRSFHLESCDNECSVP